MTSMNRMCLLCLIGLTTSVAAQPGFAVHVNVTSRAIYLRSGGYKPRLWDGVRIQVNQRWHFTLPPTPVATPTVCVDLSAFHGPSELEVDPLKRKDVTLSEPNHILTYGSWKLLPRDLATTCLH